MPGTNPMETTKEIPVPMPSPKRLPDSQCSTYQFPVSRWSNWLVVSGYGGGLAITFFFCSLVGLPAAIFWSFAVFVFCVGLTCPGNLSSGNDTLHERIAP